MYSGNDVKLFFNLNCLSESIKQQRISSQEKEQKEQKKRAERVENKEGKIESIAS